MQFFARSHTHTHTHTQQLSKFFSFCNFAKSLVFYFVHILLIYEFSFLYRFWNCNKNTHTLIHRVNETEKKITKILKDHCALSRSSYAHTHAHTQSHTQPNRHPWNIQRFLLASLLVLRSRRLRQLRYDKMPSDDYATRRDDDDDTTWTQQTRGYHDRPERAHKTNWRRMKTTKQMQHTARHSAASQSSSQQQHRLRWVSFV